VIWQHYRRIEHYVNKASLTTHK
ncbi:transposase, partial [Shigella dysenteriae]|nr:transposase [Shigella sonnei]EGD9679145.1 transposase [Shigella dysenteriae]EGE0143551.1 transposase [Shigella dysenteriae]MKQ12522.1 transposase [Shigella dysenteriae]